MLIDHVSESTLSLSINEFIKKLLKLPETKLESNYPALCHATLGLCKRNFLMNTETKMFPTMNNLCKLRQFGLSNELI